jgi:hypothetical protein
MAASCGLSALKRVVLRLNPTDSASERVSSDWDGTLFPDGGIVPNFSPDATKIEQRYGRKTWLHTVLDNGSRAL